MFVESLAKKKEKLEELEDELKRLERCQNEIISLGGDDLEIRERMWELEDKIRELKEEVEDE